MEVVAEHLGGAQFEVLARGHRVLCDQPIENNGSDSGMSPPEFLLASLATCAAYYAAEYLKARKLPEQGLKVRVTAEKMLHPAKLASFHIEVSTAELDSRHQAGIMRAVKSCLVHNTLLAGSHMETTLSTVPLVSV